jgi:hypothetical protein
MKGLCADYEATEAKNLKCAAKRRAKLIHKRSLRNGFVIDLCIASEYFLGCRQIPICFLVAQVVLILLIFQ